MRNFLLLCFVSSLISACAHHRDVRASASGIHKVVVSTDDKEAGSRDAISQANHFCDERKLAAAFVDEDQKYTGTMDEKDYQTGKTISKVAKVVGGTTWALGGRNESNAGGIVGLGGTAADVALGKGYTITMTFKCM